MTCAKKRGRGIIVLLLLGLVSLAGSPAHMLAAPSLPRADQVGPAIPASMPTARWALAAATGLDGRVYAIGGFGTDINTLNTVEAYDPTTNTWTASGTGAGQIAPLPTARWALAAATGPDGRIYAIGGDVAFSKPLNTVEAYDPTTNTWTTSDTAAGPAPLPTPRFGLAAVTGPDGRIYAIGGADAHGQVATVEAYDPTTNSWTTSGTGAGQTAPLPTPRTGLAAVSGPDGRIYAIGGADANGNALTTVEAYDPATNTWTTSGTGAGQIAPLPSAGWFLAATTGPDGRIYAIGGGDDPNSNPLNSVTTVEAYDPATNTWTASGTGTGQTAPLPTARLGLAAASGPDGRIYAIGGVNSGSACGASDVCDTVEAYDPTTNTWTTSGTTSGQSAPMPSARTSSAPTSGSGARQTAPLPSARFFLAAATGPDSRIYAIGGEDGHGNALNTMEVYDPTANTWTASGTGAGQSAPLPTARHGLAAVTGPDGRIYAIGGCCDTNGKPLSTVEAYDPTTNTWTTSGTGSDQTAPLPTARSDLAAASGPDGRIYAIGGCCDANSHALNTVEAYDPTTNTWTTSGTGAGQTAPLPTARYYLAAATGPDGRIYAIGGDDGSGAPLILSTVEAYDPTTNTWTTSGTAAGQTAPLPTARAGLAAATGPDGRIYAIGGADTDLHTLDTVEAYDPATNTWTMSGTGAGQTAPLPTARYFLAAATGPDGRIYAIGGVDANNNILPTVEAYDPTTNTWTASGRAAGQAAPPPTTRTGSAAATSTRTGRAAPLPPARSDLAAATGPDGRIYAIGGQDASGDSLTTVEAYDPATNTWTTSGTGPGQTAPMPTARCCLAAATGPDGRIYAIGGADEDNSLTTVEAYDPTTNTWTTSGTGAGQTARLPTARAGLVAATGPDGRIYVIGGCCDAEGQDLTTVEAYSTSSNTWTTVASLPTPRESLAAATGSDGRIYAIGGYNDSIAGAVEAYDPTTNTWTTSGTGPGQTAPLPTAPWRLSAATGPDGRIYVIGGCCDANSQDLTTVEAYSASSNTWTTVASLPTPRESLAAATGPDGRIYAIGGASSGNGCGVYHICSTVEAYNPATNTWTTSGTGAGQTAPLPATSGALAAAIGPEGHIVASDGEQSRGAVRVLAAGAGWGLDAAGRRRSELRQFHRGHAGGQRRQASDRRLGAQDQRYDQRRL